MLRKFNKIVFTPISDEIVPLSNVKAGTEVIVVKIKAEKSLLQRLMSMGFIPGEKLKL